MAAQTPTPLAAQLRDIKPPVEIDDISRYLYAGVILLAAVILVAALYALYRQVRSLRRTNLRKRYLEQFRSIDWSHPKEAAYTATRLGRLIAQDDRQKELLAQMIGHLEPYKYKKEVDALDATTRAQVDLFLKACDGSL